jgi:hypothetical protein
LEGLLGSAKVVMGKYTVLQVVGGEMAASVRE